MTAALTLTDLVGRHGQLQAVKGLSLTVAEHEVLAVIGANGAGKTTFAREFLPNEAGCPQFMNADLIAAGLACLFTPVGTVLGVFSLITLLRPQVKAAFDPPASTA